MDYEQKNINVKTKAVELKFDMGADPEFIIVDRQSLVDSHAIIKNGIDEFGMDAHRHIFEVRPDPSENPLEVVANMRGAMVRQCLKNPKFLDWDWFAGSYHQHSGQNLGIGGHIHFGLPKVFRNGLEKIKDGKLAGQEDYKRISTILSQYVGAVSVLIEDKDQGYHRRNGFAAGNGTKYGFIDDWRNQEWGFEYRTPSSWMTAPNVACAIMCLGKVVMNEIVNNDKFKAPNRVKNNHIMEMDITSLRQMWPDIWNEITRMSLYPQYKNYLDLLHFMVKKEVTWFPRASLKSAWGIVDLSSANGGRLQMSSIWQKFAQKHGGIIVAKKA